MFNHLHHEDTQMEVREAEVMEVQEAEVVEDKGVEDEQQKALDMVRLERLHDEQYSEWVGKDVRAEWKKIRGWLIINVIIIFVQADV